MAEDRTEQVLSLAAGSMIINTDRASAGRRGNEDNKPGQHRIEAFLIEWVGRVQSS